MFNRVNAFLEAMDKKTEEMADAAEEQDIARAIHQHQQQQQQQQLEQPHFRTSAPSSATSSNYHSSGGLPLATGYNNPPPPPRSASTGGSGSASPALRSRSAAAGVGNTIGQSSYPASVVDAQGDFYHRNVLNPVPLSLPTKLPSFRPSVDDALPGANTATTAFNAQRRGSIAGPDGAPQPAHTLVTTTTSSSPDATGAVDGSQAVALDVVSSGLGRGEDGVVLERLQARCAALEADKIKWQQEAATHKAQCSTARDALWKAEQEARSARAAQRDAEQALAAYKETSQRLLDEAQQEVRRAQATAARSLKNADGSGGGSKDDEADVSGDGMSPFSTAQREELAEAREVRQRLELLQAEHTALLAEVDRYQQETAKAAAELQRVQSTARRAEAQVDALQLDVHSARELLEGEVAAHADTKRALRELQAQQQQQQQQQQRQQSSSETVWRDKDGAPVDDTAAASADVGQLQRELREVKQRLQLTTLQLSNKQTLLDSAEREIADLKGRFNELARQFDDAQVEVAAGFRPSAMSSSTAGGYGAQRARYMAGDAVNSRGEDDATLFATTPSGPLAGHAGSSSGGGGNHASSTIASPDGLRRSPAMVRLARQYGVAGRAAVSALCSIDAAALRLGRVLTQARWVWRVILMGYISLLQLWVVLLILANLASEEQEKIMLLHAVTDAPQSPM